MEILCTIILYFFMIFSVYKLSYYMYNSKYKINKRLAWIAVFLLLTLIGAFRGDTGTDSHMYQLAYENINLVSRWQDFEIGFVWLINFLKWLHFPVQALFFVMQAIMVFFTFLFIEREKDYIDATVSVGIFMMDLYFISWNIVRQSAAMAILLYAMSLFIDKKYIKSLFLILFASLFHMSALIGLAIIFGNFLFKNKYGKWVIIISLYAILYIIQHREELGDIVHKITRSSYYAAYITRNAKSESDIFTFIIKNIIPLLIGLIVIFITKKKEKRMRVYSGAMLCGYAFSLLGIITATYVSRLGEYFTYLSIIVCGFFANHSFEVLDKNIDKKKIKFIILTYFFVMFLYEKIYKGYEGLIPYQAFSFKFD